jgi:hypothetical protein
MDTDTLRPVELMPDDEVLATFGTSEDPARRGFDEAAYTRVLAYELVRARHRLAHYRALYASFIEAGQPFMIENGNERAVDGGIPAKLIFSDDAGHVLEIEERPDVVIWTEAVLLDALSLERAVHDYFTELLDELEPALRSA